MSRDQSLDELARLLHKADRGSAIAQKLSNKMQPTFGTITDVADPDNHGRIKVVLDEMNPEFLTEKGFPQGGAQPTVTDWIEPGIPFQGVQPEALIGKRVPISPRAGDPNRLSFGDPVFDPAETSKAEQPANSAMTRLPIYPSGSLPSAGPENIGCMVVEEGGPCSSDWLCVCLRRRGQWLWIRHIDLNHIHADQDDGRQGPDSDGDGEEPVDEGPIWDKVAPTSDKAYSYQSYDEMDSGYFGGA